MRLLTFGLANTEEELVRLCENSEDGGACINVEDNILKEALHRLGEPDVDLVLDARNFPDPHHRKITKHPGFYPENMNRIVENRKFKPFLQDVSKKWRRAVAEQMKQHPGLPLQMVIAVYCRSGKHRSVAIAECLRYIGETVEGLMFLHPVKHLAKPTWGKNMCKGTCSKCKNDVDGLRQKCLEYAAAEWQKYAACNFTD